MRAFRSPRGGGRRRAGRAGRGGTPDARRGHEQQVSPSAVNRGAPEHAARRPQSPGGGARQNGDRPVALPWPAVHRVPRASRTGYGHGRAHTDAWAFVELTRSAGGAVARRERRGTAVGRQECSQLARGDFTRLSRRASLLAVVPARGTAARTALVRRRHAPVPSRRARSRARRAARSPEERPARYAAPLPFAPPPPTPPPPGPTCPSPRPWRRRTGPSSSLRSALEPIAGELRPRWPTAMATRSAAPAQPGYHLLAEIRIQCKPRRRAIGHQYRELTGATGEHRRVGRAVRPRVAAQQAGHARWREDFTGGAVERHN